MTRVTLGILFLVLLTSILISYELIAEEIEDIKLSMILLKIDLIGATSTIDEYSPDSSNSTENSES